MAEGFCVNPAELLVCLRCAAAPLLAWLTVIGCLGRQAVNAALGNSRILFEY